MAKKIRIIPWLDESQLNKQLKNLSKRNQKIQVNVDGKGINSVTSGVRQMNNAVANSNSLFSKLKNTIGSTFSSGKLAMTGYLMVLREINKASQNAKMSIQEIDKAVTDLSIAAGQSREAVGALINEYNKEAKELSSTTTQITAAADDYLRAGKTMSEAQALIKDSIMLSKLGQLDSSESTADLLAVMNGYEMTIDEVSKALDSMVAIDMAAATSSGDIATALKYCASSADVAGVSFDKLAAMIGTVQDKTQQSAETVGTFMNTLLSRYRDVKIGRFVDDDGEDLSDVEAVLGTLKIQLRDTEGEFRNFETVIDEVAQSWNDYSSVQQAAIAKAFSGTRQQNRFIALMEGYNKTLELTEVAANSAGTALEKFNNSYADSLEAQQNRLQASFESLVINSDFDEIYSDIIQATTALVEFINKTNALKGVLTGFTVSSGIKFFLAAKTGATEAYISLNQFANALKIVKQTNIPTGDFSKLLLLSNSLSDSQMKLLLSSKSLSVAQKELILVNSGLSTEEAKLQLQTWGMTTAQTGLTAATTTLGNAFKGLMATMAANPIMLVTTAVSGAVMAYNSYNQKLEEARQKNLEASDAAIEHANSLNELYTEYSRLSSIQGRTATEEENFKTVIEDITEAIGGKTEALQGLTAGTKEYADALARVTKEELQSAAVEATIGRKAAEEELQKDVWSNWKGSLVTVDSNSKGKALSEGAQKAADAVSDVLKDFETVNRTWKNLSWDISSDDPEEALAYYNALIKAREQLVIASEKDEELLNTEIYSDLNTAINAMSDSMDVYLQKRYEEEKLNYTVQNGIPNTTEEYNVMESALMSAAGASEDLQNSFQKLLAEDFAGLVADIDDTSKRLQNSLRQITDDHGIADRDEYTTLINYTKDFTAEQVELWLKATQGANGAADAIKRYEQELVKSTDSTDSTPLLSVSQTIDQLNTQLKPAFDSLKSAYQDIFTDDGFTLENVDLSMLDSIKSAIDDLNSIEGVNISIDYSSFEDLSRVLTDSSSTAEDVHNAINTLATDIVNGLNPSLAQCSGENYELVQSLLESVGIMNSEEVMISSLGYSYEEYIAAKEEAALAGFDLANATESEINAFVQEAIESGTCGEALALLQLKKLLVNSTTINTAADVQQIMNLASAASMGADVLTQLANAKSILSTVENGGTVSLASYEKALSDVEDAKQKILDFEPVTVDFDFSGVNSGKSAASKAGKEAGESYADAFNSALSGITTMLDRRISALNEEKEAAVDALETERDARIEVIEAQKEQLEEQIKLIDAQIEAKQKVIDSIQDEIDAMKEANEERQRQIDLQKAQYELERMQNQRTILQYSEEKGMHYVTDDSGIRDARQEVEDAKLEIEIANKEKQIDLIEKEIDLLEEQKDSINDQIDVLDEQIEKINKYYDVTIKNTEKYWNSLIQGLEDQKSRWEELADMEKVAEAYASIQKIFGELGYTVEDVLNGDAQAFEDFKNKYLEILNMEHKDSNFTDGLVYASGIAKESLGTIIGKTKETTDTLGTLVDSASKLDSVATGMDNVSTSASSLSDSTDRLGDNLDGISGALTSIPDSEGLSGWVTAFDDLAEAIKNVSAALGVGAEGTVEGLVGALTSLNTLSIGEDEGITAQFNALKQAVDEVTAAISGGGGSGEGIGGESGAGGQSSASASGLVGAIDSMKQAVDTALGTGGGEEGAESEGGSGAIGQFEQLKDAVDSVAAAIGNESEGGGSKNQDEENLTGAINDLGETTTEILSGGEDGGEAGVISRFEEFKDVIGEAQEHVTGISDGLAAIDGQEVECSIKVNIKTNGSIPQFATGTMLPASMNLNSAEYQAKYGAAHVTGTANVKGNWGVREAGRSLVGELGQEVWIHSGNGTFETVGDRGAEFIDVKKGDIILNHLQTKELLSKGSIVGRGQSFANGSGNSHLESNIRDLQPGDSLYDDIMKFQAYFDSLDNAMDALAVPVQEIQKDMKTAVQQISNVNNVNNSRVQQNVTQEFHITLPNVTDSTSATALMNDLQTIAVKKLQMFT